MALVALGSRAMVRYTVNIAVFVVIIVSVRMLACFVLCHWYEGIADLHFRAGCKNRSPMRGAEKKKGKK